MKVMPGAKELCGFLDQINVPRYTSVASIRKFSFQILQGMETP